MKSIGFLFVIGMILTGGVLSAQKTKMGTIRISDAKAELEGEMLNVAFTLDCSGLNMRHNDKWKVEPVVLTREGDTLCMPCVLLLGKVQNKVNRPWKRFEGNDTKELPYFSVNIRKEPVLHYDENIPFDERMYGGQVILLGERIGYPVYRKELASLSLADLPKPLQLAFIVPEAVMQEERRMPVYVYFPCDRTVVLPDFGNNAEELEKIDYLMEIVADHPNVRLNEVHLKGYASPEGTPAHNSRLAARRMAAVKDYIQTKYAPEALSLTVEPASEGWDDLRNWVDSSDLAMRTQLMAVIDNTSDPEVRNERIRNLDGGKIYRYLQKEFYPALRRVDCTVKYTIEEPYTLEEIGEMLEKEPDQLSLNELFLMARCYPPGSDDFNQVFMIAARLYPEDEIVNANRAALALQNGDLETARQCLGYDNHYAEAWNNLGVLLLSEGRVPEAVSCFEDAKACGCEEAAYNLNQVIAENIK